MQRLGQHFFKNPSLLLDIVSALKIQKNDVVLEVGPGHGELTMPLLDAVSKANGRVISIEKDHALIAALIKVSEEGTPGQFTIIEGDALRVLPEIVSGLDKGKSGPFSYKIVGNIPYYITGKLLRVMSELKNKPQCTVLMIQKEVALRICAHPPAMNRLAASVQFWADAEVGAIVPRKDFSPPPKVDSAVIVLTAKDRGENIEEALYYRAVRGVFSQPRKTILNNISAGALKSISKEDVTAALRSVRIDPQARPQDLSIEEVITIAKLPLWG